MQRPKPTNLNRTGRGVALSDVAQRIFPEVKSLAREPAGRVVTRLHPFHHQPDGRASVPAQANSLSLHPLKVLEGSSWQVDEWMADARIDIDILYRYGQPMSSYEQALATVDSYVIGQAGDRRTSARECLSARSTGCP